MAEDDDDDDVKARRLGLLLFVLFFTGAALTNDWLPSGTVPFARVLWMILGGVAMWPVAVVGLMIVLVALEFVDELRRGG